MLLEHLVAARLEGVEPLSRRAPALAHALGGGVVDEGVDVGDGDADALGVAQEARAADQHGGHLEHVDGVGAALVVAPAVLDVAEDALDDAPRAEPAGRVGAPAGLVELAGGVAVVDKEPVVEAGGEGEARGHRRGELLRPL